MTKSISSRKRKADDTESRAAHTSKRHTPTKRQNRPKPIQTPNTLFPAPIFYTVITKVRATRKTKNMRTM